MRRIRKGKKIVISGRPHIYHTHTHVYIVTFGKVKINRWNMKREEEKKPQESLRNIENIAEGRLYTMTESSSLSLSTPIG